MGDASATSFHARSRLARLAASCAVLLLACGDASSELRIHTPPTALSLDPAVISLPEEGDRGLRWSGSSIGELECRAEDCPDRAADSAIRITCVDDICNPASSEVCLDVGGRIDLEEAEPELDQVLREIERVDVAALSYAVVDNSLSIPLPALTLLFGPEEARRANEAGVRPLGQTEPILAGETDAEDEERTLDLDEEGADALAEYLRDKGRVIRLFACATVDLEPGDAFPEGDLTLDVGLQVRLLGPTSR